MIDNKELMESECCSDCLMLIANCDTSGNSRCETEEGEKAYLETFAKNAGDVYWFPSSWPTEEGEEWSEEDKANGSDCAGRFEHHGCRFCDSDWSAGDFYPVAGWKVNKL